MLLLDTDHFSVLTDARHSKHSRLIERLSLTEEAVAIPIVSVEEQLRAWLAQINRLRDVRRQIYAYDRLTRLLQIFGEWEIAGWTDPAASEFVRLRQARVRIGTQDLKIAAIAMSNDATLLSANLRDFERVPGLQVDDWLQS
jgi:tRNA(fMet)-specific endonuclease VapC